jgi:hypothetical protein
LFGVVLTAFGRLQLRVHDVRAIHGERNPAAPGLVKLEERSHSAPGSSSTWFSSVSEGALDLNAFKFGLRIGNSNLVKLVAQATTRKRR